MELRADLVNLTSPSQAKIALFRSLFRGREDVYPRRFENRKYRKEPPVVGELPKTLEVVLANQIYIAKSGLHPGLRNRRLCLAAFQNPSSTKRRRCGCPRTTSLASLPDRQCHFLVAQRRSGVSTSSDYVRCRR